MNVNSFHKIDFEEERKKVKTFDFDVSISYASEDIVIAEKIALALEQEGVIVFFAAFHKVELWGKNLIDFFQGIFGPRTRFVLLLISKQYSKKDWTDLELYFMKTEAKKRQTEFILPVKLDNTKILGIHDDVFYLDIYKEGVEGIVKCVVEKLRYD